MDEEKNLKPEANETELQESVSEEMNQAPQESAPVEANEKTVVEQPPETDVPTIEVENQPTDPFEKGKSEEITEKLTKEIVEETPEETAEATTEEQSQEEPPADSSVQEELTAPPIVEPTVVYRWDYGAQRQFDETVRHKKEGKKSRLAFFGIISCAFLIVIGLLIGVLAFRDYLTPKPETPGTVKIAEKLLPATVLITATKGATGSYGSGFFVGENGLIVTNYHVVEDTDTIKIKLYGSNEKKDARLIGFNAECDIAVLKIDGHGYPTVTFGNSDALRVGDTAIAIGNPAGADAEWTVTQGIISSVNRKILMTESVEIAELQMLQTDAAVNPGNSGGLLCNDQGEVIGIIARKQVYRVIASETNETVTIFDEGIGYAIPGNGAKQIIEGIINLKRVDPVKAGLMRKRPQIGISVVTIKKGEKLMEEQLIEAPKDGVLVSSVSPYGANGLLQIGDIIVSFDGKDVKESDELIERLYSYKRGDKVKVVIYKNGETTPTEIELTLGVFEV
ncbi:MAG: PDZ domain-containing protein [Ruminococcaceae bacterium]|nr:PDZ domain-containing protein [Oscillospiraceae bacterium]